jgi:predicted nucleic-acid-binding Zn-ribbon protein
MRNSDKCPKCASQRLIKGIRIFGHRLDDSKSDLTVEIYEEPDALIFKGTHQGTLQAWICGDCGLTELYVSNPDELWAISSNKG